MAQYVALLRGINVGGNKKVEMAKLRKTFEALGFANVSTYINSGNVIFETTENGIESAIEKALKKAFGFEIRIVIRCAADIRKICEAVPREWVNGSGQKMDVLFLWDEFNGKESLKLIAATEVDALKYVAGAVVWHIDFKDYSKSGMRKFLSSKLYKHMTARNMNTVRKLAELMSDAKQVRPHKPI